MSSDLVLIDYVAPRATITLNRPDKINAFSPQLLAALQSAFDEIEKRDDVKIVVIKGAGRGFSVGMDVQNGYTPQDLGVVKDRERLQETLTSFLRIWDSPKIVIAQVHGYCCAAATILAMCSDIIIITEDCKIRFPSLPLGGGFVSAFWTFFVGSRKSKEMDLIAGYEIDGAEALQLGWANKAVAANQLEDAVATYVRRIGATPGDLLRLKKLAINRQCEKAGFREAMLAGAEWDTICHFSDGAQTIRSEITRLGLRQAIEQFRSADG